jgi:hypothetical protein
MSDLDKLLLPILKSYADSFSSKIYNEESNEIDPLMQVFGITQEMKCENKQFWGRQLGMCFQRMVSELCKMRCAGYKPGLRIGADEVCDLIVGTDAIDTKYRVGSGDSGTLKKFKAYGLELKNRGFSPVMAIVRTDNLAAALQQGRNGGWTIYQGKQTFDYIRKLTGVDLQQWLEKHIGRYLVRGAACDNPPTR